MKEYIAKKYVLRDILYPEDMNRIENQLAYVTDYLATISSLNNIYIRYDSSEPEPEDKSVLFIDLSDETENNSTIIDGILKEYSNSIEQLNKEVTDLKDQVAKLIASGGIIVPDVPIDNNKYIFVEENIVLLTDDNVPIIFERGEPTIDSTIIDNCILTDENKAILVDDNKVLILEN